MPHEDIFTTKYLDRKIGLTSQMIYYLEFVGGINMVKFLIEKGADVNVGNKMNYRPLHEAIRGSELIVIMIIFE